MGGGVESNLPGPVRIAYVMHCRCWDGSIYLSIDPSTHGFVHVSDRAFAIAAACQAAGRPVAVKCWGHDPDWAGGVGRFEGAILAIDRRDLEPQPPPPSVIG